MSLTHIKSKNQGFTIVELLIVVVVIAILAAITIVSYNGITTRANQSAARATAATSQKKVSLYASDPSNTTGTYPTSWATLASDSTKSYYVTGITNSSSTPTNAYTNSTVEYMLCGRASSGTSPVAAPSNLAGVTGGVITGAVIGYWDPVAVAAVYNPIDTTNYTSSGTTTTTVTVNSVVYNVACYPAP